MKFYTFEMKKIFNRACLIGAAAFMAMNLMSCDEKDKDDRYIELPAVESERVVLLEEFTGQLCVNCPDGHEIINQIAEQYPSNFIAVGIHGGGDAWSFGEDNARYVGLRNADGQQYSEEVGATSFPCGIVNRTTGLLNKEQWAASVRSELEKAANMDINVAATIQKGTIVINTTLNPYDNINGFLQLWVIENGIIAIQRNTTGFDKEYEHNHVFRGCVNGHNGESVSLITRVEKSFEHSIVKKDIWNANNLEIVAFVYTKNGGVQQAAKCHVVVNDID